MFSFFIFLILFTICCSFFLLKYVIIGDSGVGKSNILLKYTNGTFSDEFKATVGVEFGAKNIEIKKTIYRIQIWDTAGQENFRSIARAYYKNSVCACIVYDITNRNSFNSVQEWIDDCTKQTPKTILLLLIGNKNDLNDKREVQYEESEEDKLYPLENYRQLKTTQQFWKKNENPIYKDFNKKNEKIISKRNKK